MGGDQAAVHSLTCLAITRRRAREQGVCKGVQSQLSAHGSELPAKPWGQRGRLLPNSGWQTPRREGLTHLTGEGSTWWCIGPQRMARRCAVTLLWFHRSGAGARCMGVRPTKTARRYEKRDDASTLRVSGFLKGLVFFFLFNL